MNTTMPISCSTALTTNEESKMPKAEPLYYLKDNVVFKRPVRRKTETGTAITMGFPVCTVSEYIRAADLVAILNEHERPVLDEPA
jgi:hypothetical protein